MSIQLNPSAVDEAVEFLGIEAPVHIQLSRRPYSRAHGKYRGLLLRPHGSARHSRHWYEPRHVIVIETNHTIEPRSAEELSGTLWHELAHAAQCERYESWEAFLAAYSREQRQKRCKSLKSSRAVSRYKEISFEIEANEYAELSETDPLFIDTDQKVRLP